MAARLKTRFSAGAALVAGIGVMGVATALPARAEITTTYTCTVQTEDGPVSQDITVTLDTNAPEAVDPGDTLMVDSVTGTATIPMAGVSSPGDNASVTIPVTAPVQAGDSPVGDVTTALTSESISLGEGQVHIVFAGHLTRSIVIPVEAAGQSVGILAPGSFEATLSGFGELPDTVVPCTTEAGNVIDTVVVTSPEMGEGPDDAEDTAQNHDPAGADRSPTDDASTHPPNVPQVVQTDGLTPQLVTQEDNTLAYAVGGLAVAGAGAGAVLVVRRRAARD